MPQPEFLSSIDARMTLETPQVVISWEFRYPTSPLDESVPWLWTTMRLRRSAHRYPPTCSDGDAILTESYSTTPSTSKADVTVAEDETYYYSLFFEYPELNVNPLYARLDVSRLYSTVRGMLAAPPRQKVFKSDLQTTLNGTTVTSANSTFRTSGVEAGDWLLITTGPNSGYYLISQVLSETQLLLNTNTPNAGTNQSFVVYSDEVRWVLGGMTHERREVVFVYNSSTGMVDRALDLSPALTFGEYITGVLLYDDNVTDEKLHVTTNWRYLRFANPTGGALPNTLTSDYLSEQWAFEGKLQGGYRLTGATVMQSMDVVPVGDYIVLLDATHKEARGFIKSGGVWVHARTYDFSALEADDLVGLSQDTCGDGSDTYLLVGNRNWIYSITAHDDSEPGIFPYIYPVTYDHVRKVTYVRDILDGAIAWDAQGYATQGVNQVATICNLTGFWDLYQTTIGRGYIWQQEYVPDSNTVGLYHFTFGAELVDSGPYGNTAINNGMVHIDFGGKYTGGCFRAGNAGAYIDISAIAGEFNGAEGSASVWYKASSLDQLTTGTHLFLVIRADSSNQICIGTIGGNLYFGYDAGGTGKYIFGTHPNPDLEWHNYKIVWSKSGDYVKAYVDGVQFLSTKTGLGTWSGSVILARVGGDSSNSALGYYDEVRISNTPRVVSPISYVWTDRNTAHAYSGRDPISRSFNYRDEFWTQKYQGGDWFIRNDYDVSNTPVDVVMDDGEVIWRQPTKQLGDLGRLSRLLGLFLDRLTDDREHLVTALNVIERADDDYLQDIADKLGIKGLEPGPIWNVDQRRRWVLYMRRVLKEGGSRNSYHRLSALLGYKLTIDTLYTRRRLDSVVNPCRNDVYLDQQGSLDTRDTSYPLAILRFRWYKSAFFSTVGAASAGKLLTDASASFQTTARVGSLVRVYNPTDPVNDGDYYVVSVISNTILLLNQEWADTSLSGMHYSVNTHVPPPDPTAAYLLDRMNYIRPKVMRIEVL